MHVGPVGDDVSGQRLSDMSCSGRDSPGPSTITPGKAQAAPGQQAKGDAFPEPLSRHGLGKHSTVWCPAVPSACGFPLLLSRSQLGSQGTKP